MEYLAWAIVFSALMLASVIGVFAYAWWDGRLRRRVRK